MDQVSTFVEEDEELTRGKKRRKPLYVRVLVHDLSTDETIRELSLDFNDTSKRKWLLRVQIWAFHNNKSVEMLTFEADELLKIRDDHAAEPRSNFPLPD